MKTIVFPFFMVLCAQLTLADVPIAPSKASRPKPQILDLDFTDDGEESGRASPSPGPMRSGSWMFWAAGAVAAAGGLGGLWLYERTREPAVTRSEQVFTDSPP